MRFLLLLLFAFKAHAACENGILWVGISDTHYGGTPWTWEQGTNAYGAISNEVYFIQTNFNPNFFVNAGDVGENAALQYTTYLTNMAILSVPHYTIAGNHDPVGGNWSVWTNHFPRRYAWTNGNYIFIGVGSFWTSGTNGTIDTEDLDFMETVMTNTYPTWTNYIVLSHISVVTNDTFGSISPGTGLERLTNLFNYYKVITYMHGHQHSVASTPTVIPGTTTFQSFIPSLTRYASGRGAFQVFTLTNTTLISRRYRTDNHALEGAVPPVTNTVPQYVCEWPPVSAPTPIIRAGKIYVGGFGP